MHKHNARIKASYESIEGYRKLGLEYTSKRKNKIAVKHSNKNGIWDILLLLTLWYEMDNFLDWKYNWVFGVDQCTMANKW